MALNILFWLVKSFCTSLAIVTNFRQRTIALFVSAWGYKSPWLSKYLPQIGAVSKMFAAFFPGLVVGLIRVTAITDSVLWFFLVSNSTSIPSFPPESGIF